MSRRNGTALFLVLLCSPLVALSQDARSILETMQEKQQARWEGVESYVVDRSIMGTSSRTYYTRTEVEDDEGNTQVMFLPDMNAAISASSCEGDDSMTAEQLDMAADATEMTGNAMASEIEDGMEAAGLPRGLLAATGSDPTATFNPRVIMGSNAMFLRAAANAKREMAANDPSAQAMESFGHMEKFSDNATVVGTESIDGHEAFHLRAEGIDEVQRSDGREYRMDAISMWIDTSQYVPLRMKVDGTLVSGEETQPMAIETIHSDYRMVEDSKMYEAFRQTVSIAGVLDEKQQAEMKEAQAQFAEFEKQMASMPAGQRKMMEQMMGPQIERMQQMMAGDGFQTETVTHAILVNPDLAAPGGIACPER